MQIHKHLNVTPEQMTELVGKEFTVVNEPYGYYTFKIETVEIRTYSQYVPNSCKRPTVIGLFISGGITKSQWTGALLDDVAVGGTTRTESNTCSRHPLGESREHQIGTRLAAVAL